MKLFRQIALSAMVTVGVFGAILYTTSCSKDKCSGVTCNNGGTCSNGTCTCVTGYEGATCDTLSRTKFIKIWNASDMLNSHLIAYTPSIVAGTSGVTSVAISNFSDFFTGVNTNGTVNGNTITIARQNPSVNNYYVAGTGTYAAGVISWTYTIDSAGTATQNYTGTWQ